MLAAVLLAAAGVAIAVVHNGADKAARTAVAPSNPAEPGAGGVPTPVLGSVATPTPASGAPTVPLTLAAWSPAASTWRTGRLAGQALYREDEAIPVLVHFPTSPGSSYNLLLGLAGCPSSLSGISGLLLSPGGEGQAPFLEAPAPGRARPDSTMLIPPPGASPAAGAEGERLWAWGAAFVSAPTWSGERGCPAVKLLSVRLRALGDAAWLAVGVRAGAVETAAAREGDGVIIAQLGETRAELRIQPEIVAP